MLAVARNIQHIRTFSFGWGDIMYFSNIQDGVCLAYQVLNRWDLTAGEVAVNGPGESSTRKERFDHSG